MFYKKDFSSLLSLVATLSATRYSERRVDTVNRYRYETNNNTFYHSQAWRRLRRQALERDKHLCQICLQHNELTFADTVHHIKPIRSNDSEKLSLENLVTVCRKCHNELHREKPMTLKKKKRRLNSYTNLVKIFTNNKEVW